MNCRELARLLAPRFRREGEKRQAGRWCLALAMLALSWLMPLQAALALTTPAGTRITAQAQATYRMGEMVQPFTAWSPVLAINVSAVEALSLTGPANLRTPVGAPVAANYLLSNTGNVRADYRFQLDTSACSSSTLTLGNLRLAIDRNNNGVADTYEFVALGSDVLSLPAGQRANLIVTTDAPTAYGLGCIALTASTSAQAQSAAVATTVHVNAGAVLSLRKTVSHAGGPLVRGVSELDYTLTAMNLGTELAAPSPFAGPTATQVKVNGVPQTYVLLRDELPAGTTFVMGSLRTLAPGAVKLYRRASDAPFEYKMIDDATTVEVAIGLPAGVPMQSSVAMSFKTKLANAAPGQADEILNVGEVHYRSGGTEASTRSNAVVLPVADSRLGVALQNVSVVPQANAQGVTDGTAVVTFRARLRNYGIEPLHNVQLRHALAGTNAASSFGSWTSSAVPAPSQYSIVPGSTRIISLAPSNAVLAPSATFTGATGNDGLLADGGMLPVGGDVVVEYAVRVNFTGRAGTVNTTAHGFAARAADQPATLTDASFNGTDPDPANNGSPQTQASPTPVLSPPLLSLMQTVSLPRRVGNGQFEIDYNIQISNNGAVAASAVRVLENLECAVREQSNGSVTGWQLVAPPTAHNGRLTINSGFTGMAPCNDDRDVNTGAPVRAELSLTDGNSGLAPGQSETITFTLRVDLALVPGTRATLSHRVWGVAYDGTSELATRTLAFTSGVMTYSLLIDPQGIVYDTVTRAPLAGATVNVARQSCNAGPANAIDASQILGGNSGRFTYHPNGSVSMVTGPDGEYQFFWVSPPVNDLCEYSLSVTPPSGYLLSARVLPEQTVFNSCGQVVPHGGPPQGSDPTTFFTRFISGLDTATNTGCELLNNHVPLDPLSTQASVLFLEKSANKKEAELGDFIDYKVTLTNRSGTTLNGVRFDDTLPAGFSYVRGSTVFNGVRVNDPAGGAGPQLSFDRPDHSLADGASVSLVYRTTVGAGVSTAAPAINRATAHATGVSSNEATWSVKVHGGVFSDDAFAFGKVFLDCNRNGEQDGDKELGIPGVRLFTQDGTSVITDGEGRWSLFGLKPLTHVIKVDGRSLPDGAQLEAWDNRNAGSADSRFLDVKKGELAKANFPVMNCAAPGLVEAIEARRAASKSGAEFEAAAKLRITPTLSATAVSGPGQASSGSLGGSAPASRPLISMPSGLGGSINPVNSVASSTAAPAVPAGSLGPLPAAEPLALEAVMPELDSTAAFIGMKDGDTVPSRSVNVRVKGPLGAALRLNVGGSDIGERRVGKKADLESTGTTAWEYIGVALEAGKNRLQLTVVDPLGNERDKVVLHLTAPDDLGELHIDLGDGPAYADPLTPVLLSVRVTDKAGVPVTIRTPVTLEVDRGSFAGEDVNPNEPGAQVFVEGGAGTFRFTPPAEPGLVRMRATAGLLTRESSFNVLPHLQPMSGIGIVEGVLSLGKRDPQALAAGADSPHSAFEAELNSLVREGDNHRAAARTAFYFKGAVRGDYLLTAAYDSEKNTRDRLFRDIRPDEYYPVYGDDSVRGYDAQSVSKLYVRIDKGQSYLLYGDFTSSASPEVRKLSQVNRSFNGLRHHYETSQARVSSYVSRTSGKQQVEEVPANGLSFYFLGGSGDIALNSERVEIVVRNRAQPQLVVSTRVLTRNTDYTFEPLTRRLMLAQPLASVDVDFNPQSLRVSYEVDQGGPEFLTGGVDAQFKLTERLQLGVAVNKDDNPENNRRSLQAVTMMGRVGENTVVSAEVVRTESDLVGSGSGQRIELRHADEGFKLDAEISRTDATFENPGATTSAGRTEAIAKAELPINDTTRLKAELNYSKSELDAEATANRNVAIALQKKMGESVAVEVGVRNGNVSSTGASSFDYGAAPGTSIAGGSAPSTASASPDMVDSTTARARVTVRPSILPSAEVFGEVEQDVRDSDRRVTALGGSYAINSGARIYARREFESSLYEATETTESVGGNRNTTIVGVDGAYMQGGRIFNEYRMGTRGASNGTGVRNTFTLMEGLQFNVTGEHTRALSGDAEESTAATFGLDYSTGPWRAGTALEWRESDSGSAWLFNLSGAYRLDSDWSVLARSVISHTSGESSGSRRIARQQLGLAWRPANSDVINGLLRYEHRQENIGAGTGGSFYSLYGNSGAVLPGDYRTHLVAGVVNYNPSRGNMVTGRYAARFNEVKDELGRASTAAQFVHMRYTRDLTPDWDMGLQLGMLRSRGGNVQSTYGLELGYQVVKGLWLSAGYNMRGIKSDELTGQNYTDSGWYLRMRFMFDESTLGLNRRTPMGVSTAAAAPTAAAAVSTPVAYAPSKAASATGIQRKDGLDKALAGSLVWDEKLLFGSDGKLLPEGRDRLNRLGALIKNDSLNSVRLSLAHGANPKNVDAQWLPRMVAIRTALRQTCACAIGVGLDTQAVEVARDAAAADPSVPFTLYVHVTKPDPGGVIAAGR